MIAMSQAVGTHDLLMVTLDTLRFDVAHAEHLAGRTPHLSSLLPDTGWERRHTPGTFTYAAHCAFFAGFLPTPATPEGPRSPRHFAARFPGSVTSKSSTCIFDTPDIVSGLRGLGYHTACIGGVGFFNKRSPLGQVLPALFDESHWEERLGVTCPDSTEHQFACASSIIERVPPNQRLFLFINISALHQPNRHYVEGATEDTLETHAAALRYVDGQWPSLLQALRTRGPWVALVFSDHGTCYGDDGFTGHRLVHPAVTHVPYTEWVLPSL